MKTRSLYNAVNTLCLNHFQPVFLIPCLFLLSTHPPLIGIYTRKMVSVYLLPWWRPVPRIYNILELTRKNSPTFSRKKVKKFFKFLRNKWAKRITTFRKLTVGFVKIFYMYFIQHCFICRPSDSTVSEDAGIEPMTVAQRHWRSEARSHPHSARPHPFESCYINKQKLCFPHLYDN